MKIVQVFNRYLELGGEEKSASRIANHLRQGGHEVFQFWRSSSEWESEDSPTRLVQVLKIAGNRPVLNELKKLHAEVNADIWILHNVLPVISLGVYSLAKELDVPIVQWLHNYRPLSVSGVLPANSHGVYLTEIMQASWRSSHLQTAVLAAHYSLARMQGKFDSVALWLAVSESMRKRFASRGWYESRLAALHHSWDTADVVARKTVKPYYLFLGRIIEEKGIRFLVELFSHPDLQEFNLFIGGSGVLEEELKQISTKNVTWLGFVTGEQKRQLVRNASAVLFPSLWEEPLSTVAYEAFEQETCLISSDSGGMTEIINHGKTGIILPAGNQSAWLLKLKKLTAEEMEELGINSRNWLLKNVNAARWNKLFLDILSKHDVIKPAAD